MAQAGYKIRDQQEVHFITRTVVRAGLAWEPWEYRYSSACDDMNNKMDGLKLILFRFSFNWIGKLSLWET